MQTKLKIFPFKYLLKSAVFKLKFWQKNRLMVLLLAINLFLYLCLFVFFLNAELSKFYELKNSINAKAVFAHTDELDVKKINTATIELKKTLAEKKFLTQGDNGIDFLNELNGIVKSAQLETSAIEPIYRAKKLYQINVFGKSKWTNFAKFLQNLGSQLFTFKIVDIEIYLDSDSLTSFNLVLENYTAKAYSDKIFFSYADDEKNADEDIFLSQLVNLKSLRNAKLNFLKSPFAKPIVAHKTLANLQQNTPIKSMLKTELPRLELQLIGIFKYSNITRVSISVNEKLFTGLKLGDFIADTPMQVVQISNADYSVRIKNMETKKMLVLTLKK